MAVPAAKLPAGHASTTGSYPRLVHGGGGPPAGGRRRGAVDNGVLGMALFLGTETMLFAGLISALLILRAANDAWPPPGQPRLPVGVTGLNTVVLLLSAVTMRRATSAARQRDCERAPRWLNATALLGAVFLIIQGREWVQLVHYGLNASSSPFGATFYTLIGCHALHVLAALATLVVVRVRAGRWLSRDAGRGALDVCELYWFFVVGVWPILYLLVYCM
jgi:cytochrome c oxidase subunit 3